MRRILRGETTVYLSDASLWRLGCLPLLTLQICVLSGKGQSWGGLSHCLSQDLQSLPPSCRSPTSSTPGELRPLLPEAPPPRVCALAKGRGSGALTPGGRRGRAEGKRGLGLARIARGGRGEGGETVVGLLIVLELVRPEGRGESGGGRRQQHGGGV